MYLPRTLEKFFKEVSRQFPVLLVTGPRQVGKTTFLLHQQEPERTYVTLDDPMLRNLAKEDPGVFLQRFPPPILIDEIQYAPELLPFIKMAIDKNRRPGMFWLTGSQQFHLMKDVSESLAGRVGVLNLLGFSQRELTGFKQVPFLPPITPDSEASQEKPSLNLRELYTRIWRGSYPEIALNDQFDRDLFYASYVQTYIQRDIRDLARVGNEMAFLRFLRAAAARSGQLLNMADMARDADISQGTAKNWLSTLQTSGIIYLLEPYHTNATKRLIKSPKLYLLDTGLAAYLTEWSSPETLEAGAMSGPILETWIVNEVLKSYWHNGLRAPLYFYRDKDKKEIDMLIIKDGTIYPLEFKKTASPEKKRFSHFSVLTKLNLPIGPAGVICLTETVLPLTSKLQAIPVAAI